ncbi:1-acyl-sn-glycerol-3-phosphate acyltransferase [Quadrisphaera granulorum]|uniref:1-acyl-sn-glycerol-3-phosphate acyltransferase n=1 Tax=Quadrisphaera granulorum TaxID=317664 RepID=A0A316AIV9_9ACTN|nr:lysophospholipid acyltransferase family protein [Quadrisphaera granulorum]PWJ49887.1 1-acyl-sn-glycerol-3-phosphate acyltransferase [Quadrisphaera granulorum]SZE98095.1 1-acyl-sn-glycerol-3-phosphate acyltransferase [Quadrisphaera granulorum]
MLYWLFKAVLYPILTSLFRPEVKGLEHVPLTGPAVLASNHLSVSDSFFLPLVIPRRVSFMAKAEYFTGRGVKGRLTAGFFKGIGQLPVDRSGGKASQAAIDLALQVLDRGELFGIYPEGTRSPDGRLYRGKTGVARVALTSGVPVLPVAMHGTDKVQPIGRRIPRIRRVGITIGAPLDFSRYEGMENDRFVLRSVTDEITYEIMRLSGQEYVDVYAASMKERLAAGAKERRVPFRTSKAASANGPGTTSAPADGPEVLAAGPDADSTSRRAHEPELGPEELGDVGTALPAEPTPEPTPEPPPDGPGGAPR